MGRRRARVVGPLVVGLLAAMLAAWLLYVPPLDEPAPAEAIPVRATLRPAAPAELPPAPVVDPPPMPAPASTPAPAPAVEGDTGRVRQPVPLGATLSVDVITESGGLPEGSVRVYGCGLFGELPHDEVELPVGSCTLTAYHQLGLLSHISDPITLDARDGDHFEVELVVPDGPPAGMGIVLELVDGGILVDDVVPGSPADRAGLGHGDLILGIDGESTEDMLVPDFIRMGVGSPGTEVRLQVLGPDGEREVVLTREVLEG